MHCEIYFGFWCTGSNDATSLFATKVGLAPTLFARHSPIWHRNGNEMRTNLRSAISNPESFFWLNQMRKKSGGSEIDPSSPFWAARG